MSMIKLTLQDLWCEEINEDKDLCGFDGSTNEASDGPPRRVNTSGAGSIAHYQGPCWIISEQRDPVTGTNKHILHFPIKLPSVATSRAQINVSVYLITEVVEENVTGLQWRSQTEFNRLGSTSICGLLCRSAKWIFVRTVMQIAKSPELDRPWNDPVNGPQSLVAEGFTVKTNIITIFLWYIEKIKQQDNHTNNWVSPVCLFHRLSAFWSRFFSMSSHGMDSSLHTKMLQAVGF